MLKNICPEDLLEIVIKASLAKFVFSEIPCFKNILLNTFRQMRLKYENYFLRNIFFLDIQTTFRL